VARHIRIGLYCDMRNPGGARSWADLYAATLDRIAAAEERGLEAVWTTEHHGFADGYLPQPLVMCAAIAARTSRVRIGTAVALAPLIHPQHLAEQAALVDILSGGRLELGLGAGWKAEEFDSFGADRAERYGALLSAAAALEELWESGTATPPPVQRPLPLWLGLRGPRGARMAGRIGAGLLWIDRELMDPYRDGLEEGGHDQGCARVAGLVNVYLADDPEAALERIRGGARHRRDTYKGAETKGRAAAAPRLEVLTPADAAKRIVELTDGLPVTDVFCFDRVGTDSELSDRHVELLTGELPGLLAAELVG
jgi:alkanesulfonate monooxygenase SsuD/methylene tetrahydromethanopterin reductase-like flavin-dependent oxidoreductase (luciferase family)